MKTKEAIAIMNDENSTVDQLREVETFFKNAGLKGLLATVQGTLRRRTTPPKPFETAALRAVAGALLLVKCDRVIREYEAEHGHKPGNMRAMANAIPIPGSVSATHPVCDCRPDEYSTCAAKTCPNSCVIGDEIFDYLPLDER